MGVGSWALRHDLAESLYDAQATLDHFGRQSEAILILRPSRHVPEFSDVLDRDDEDVPTGSYRVQGSQDGGSLRRFTIKRSQQHTGINEHGHQSWSR
jgi:hypothetical protein